MLPKTAAGWIILILVVLMLMYGVSGGIAQAGVIIHDLINGIRSFAAHVRSG